MAKYKETKPENSDGCDDGVTGIFPGGGDCGGGGGACTGPDCPDPGTGDDPCLSINPPADCFPPDDDGDGCYDIIQECVGPGCRNVQEMIDDGVLGLNLAKLNPLSGYCGGWANKDCMYVGGKYHAYHEMSWGCSDNNPWCPPFGPNQYDASCPMVDTGDPAARYSLVLPFFNYATPYPLSVGGVLNPLGGQKMRNNYKKWIGGDEHFRLSQQEMGRTIGMGEGFYPANGYAMPGQYQKVGYWKPDPGNIPPINKYHSGNTFTRAQKDNPWASTIPHPWGYSGKGGVWGGGFQGGGHLGFYGGNMFGAWDSFSGKTDPYPLEPAWPAMVPKDHDQFFMYIGKVHCPPRHTRPILPWAVSSPGIITANTDQLFATGGSLNIGNSNIGMTSLHMPAAYDLTNSDASLSYFIAGNTAGIPVMLMPGNDGDYPIGKKSNGYGLMMWPREVGTTICYRGSDDDPVDCMDPLAFNYNPRAIVHDVDVCCYIEGCTDDRAFNYNVDACSDDGLCCKVSGCTDPLAVNYDTDNAACFDDGSCCYIAGCTNPLDVVNYNPLACEDDGSCILPEEDGYTYGLWCEHFTLPNGYTETNNYAFPLKPGMLSPGADVSYSYGAWGCTDQAPLMDPAQAGIEIKDVTGTNKLLQPGDTVSPDLNPNQACTTYIGTIESVTDLVSSNQLDIGNGQTIQVPSSGGEHGPCPAFNQWWDHTIIGNNFSDSCSTCCDKISDPNCDLGSGCDEPLAVNYNPSATNIDNDTCEWVVPRYCAATTSELGVGTDNVYLYGDPNNSSPDFSTGTLKDNIGHLQTYLANLPGIPSSPTVPFYVAEGFAGSNGSACFVWLGWDTYIGDGSILFNSTDGFAGGPTLAGEGPYGSPSTTYTNILSGGTVITANDLDPCGQCNAWDEPSGCTDPSASNYDQFATIDDGSCRYGVIRGCMLDTSTLYNLSATVDDGSCEWRVCLNPSGNALNEGYLLGQVDPSGMAIPLSQTMIDYDTLNPGAIIEINSFGGGECVACGPYDNLNGASKVALTNILNAGNHVSPDVQAFFLASDIILDLGYPPASGLVLFPNTDELNAPLGIPGNYPQYGFDPAVRVTDSSSVVTNVTLDAGNTNVIEYPVVGTPKLGKAFLLNGYTSNNGSNSLASITHKGTGCEYSYETIDNSAPLCEDVCIQLALTYETPTSLSLSILGTSNNISVLAYVSDIPIGGSTQQIIFETADPNGLYQGAPVGNLYSPTMANDYITNDKIYGTTTGQQVTVTVTENCNGQTCTIRATIIDDDVLMGTIAQSESCGDCF